MQSPKKFSRTSFVHQDEKQCDINGQKVKLLQLCSRASLSYFYNIAAFLQNLFEFCLSKHPFQIQVTKKYYADHLCIL